MIDARPIDDEWLSLTEASELLGVAASTLRRWGDAGKVPMKRTLGGHRRFSRAGLLKVMEEAQPHVSPSTPAPLSFLRFDAHAMARADWHSRLMTHSNADRMRGLGQRLLGLLIQYINRQEEDERFLNEARVIGSGYGRETRDAGVSMHDTVQAFLFFRNSFARLAMPVPGITQPNDLDQAVALHARIDRFMDAVLLGAITGYEQQE
ncbi:MerR family transcriptional regulator [Roseiflexus castenholzii]|jgi:excisionase family DNA binding protein|uniref:DNA binding domain, excisionase family n=1 Tax=Roseiflexus castenholzii (strain DSM 13941 / HLO8) TaxID=383372 RepID=A7NKU3_ROSCS|nr:helix-turn-helix domain-containing protein [Roseiflexus castenholzii]ABU58113.1 DNA binding domain, excisionase family [Roseiflexus castenholzii DSM 13941]